MKLYWVNTTDNTLRWHPTSNKNERQTKEPKDANDFNEIIPPKSQIFYALPWYHSNNTLLIQGNYRDTWVNNEYPILKPTMKEKEKHNIELEQAYIKILELSSFRDPLNIPCIIITPPPTANDEEYGIQTNNSANQMTDNPT